MKEETRTRTRTVKETYTAYVAYDGKEFADRNSCMCHEMETRIAEGMSELLKLNARKVSDRRAYDGIDELVNYGNCTGTYYIVEPRNAEECNFFVDCLNETTGCLYFRNNKEKRDNAFNISREEFTPGRKYVIAIGEGNDWSMILTRESLTNWFNRTVSGLFD